MLGNAAEQGGPGTQKVGAIFLDTGKKMETEMFHVDLFV